MGISSDDGDVFTLCCLCARGVYEAQLIKDFVEWWTAFKRNSTLIRKWNTKCKHCTPFIQCIQHPAAHINRQAQNILYPVLKKLIAIKLNDSKLRGCNLQILSVGECIQEMCMHLLVRSWMLLQLYYAVRYSLLLVSLCVCSKSGEWSARYTTTTSK